MLVATRFLLLCVAILALPAVADAQCVSSIAIQRIWMMDAAGNDKTTVAPGEKVQLAAQLNNIYGGWMLGANGAQLTVATDFYNDTKQVDIPPGMSYWTWNTTAPSKQGNYTVTVKAYDHFCGVFSEGSANFTVTSNPITSVPSPQLPTTSALHAPGWYYNGAGLSPPFYTNSAGLTIEWQNSYIYRYPGGSALYWYVEVMYRNNNKSKMPLTISCTGMTDPSFIKEHMRGTPNSGSVGADDTFCNRNKTFSATLNFQEAHVNWAIFHNVPWQAQGSQVRIQWGNYGFSPWVYPWYLSYPSDTSPPAECPLELVKLGTCQPAQEGPPHYVCAGEPCNNSRTSITLAGPTAEQITNGTLCAVELLPGGGTIKTITLVTSVGGSFIGVVDDVYTGQPYKVLLEFIPFNSCFKLIGSLTPIRQVE